jgi:hypothetical protein
MNALQMMLKSMGFDPAEMLDNVKKMGEMIAEMHASQLRTEAMVKRILDLSDPVKENQKVYNG